MFRWRQRLVQRFLFDPDGGAGDGLAVPQVATQDVLAELGRVNAPATGRLHAEALLKETLQDLQGRTVNVTQYKSEILILHLSLFFSYFLPQLLHLTDSFSYFTH